MTNQSGDIARIGEASTGLLRRRLIFADPERSVVRISHDGTRIAFRAPLDGVLNLWVAPIDRIGDARPVTAVTDRNLGPWIVWMHDKLCRRSVATVVQPGERQGEPGDGPLQLRKRPLSRCFEPIGEAIGNVVLDHSAVLEALRTARLEQRQQQIIGIAPDRERLPVIVVHHFPGADQRFRHAVDRAPPGFRFSGVASHALAKRCRKAARRDAAQPGRSTPAPPQTLRARAPHPRRI